MSTATDDSGVAAKLDYSTAVPSEEAISAPLKLNQNNEEMSTMNDATAVSVPVSTTPDEANTSMDTTKDEL